MGNVWNCFQKNLKKGNNKKSNKTSENEQPDEKSAENDDKIDNEERDNLVGNVVEVPVNALYMVPKSQLMHDPYRKQDDMNWKKGRIERQKLVAEDLRCHLEKEKAMEEQKLKELKKLYDLNPKDGLYVLLSLSSGEKGEEDSHDKKMSSKTTLCEEGNKNPLGADKYDGRTNSKRRQQNK